MHWWFNKLACQMEILLLYCHHVGWNSKEGILKCDWPWFDLTGGTFYLYFDESLLSPSWLLLLMGLQAFTFKSLLLHSHEPIERDVDILFFKIIHPIFHSPRAALELQGKIKAETELWYTRLWMLEETKAKPSYSLISWRVSISAANWTVTLTFNY